MLYTRLSIYFQPKTAHYQRRWLLLSSFAVLVNWQSVNIRPVLADSDAPNYRTAPSMSHAISDENGRSFTVASLRGRPVLINFWATWCTPCLVEMPSLQKAAKKLQSDGIDVLLSSVDRGAPRKALPVLQSKGVTLPRFGFDPKAALSREMGVSGLPTSFVLSADQKQCLIYVGPREWHEEVMLDDIRHFARMSRDPSQSG